MSSRLQLFEKYRKSDIFNTNPPKNTCITKRQPIRLNDINSFSNTQNDIFHITETEKPLTSRKYNLKNHGSDIFNLHNKTFEEPKKSSKNIKNKSTFFDSMKDNEQFANDIKEYASKNRGKKTEYKPDKYYHYENASEISTITHSLFGLNNLGSTCYMNSALQKYYIINYMIKKGIQY